MTELSKTNIMEEIVSIIKKLFETDITCIGKGYENEKLLGIKIRLNASQLVYVLLECERLFKIKIPQEDIVKGSFDTVNNIADIIYKQLKINQKQAI